MAMKRTIQSDLLGAAVTIVNGWPQTSLDGKRGRIRQVYVTADGPKLTVELNETHRLVELFTSAVEVRG